MSINIGQLMVSSSVKFGTSGARGLVSDMTDFVCFAYTLGFLRHAANLAEAEGGPTFDRVAVAYDLRDSSPRIARSIFKAIEVFGCQGIDCGTIPTPALVLYGITEKIPSIMITGSHIAEDRNGLKFHLASSEILKRDEVAIREINVDIPADLFDEKGNLKEAQTLSLPRNEHQKAYGYYIDRYVRAFSSSALTGCRIGLYEHSSVARDILYDLYTALGATVTRLGRSETFVAVDTEAIRDEDLYLAKTWASGKNLPKGVTGSLENPPFDIIVSTDGDGDRPLIFDEHGRWIRGDDIGIIAARQLMADYVVTPVSTSTALERSGWFRKIVRTKIGSPYVVEAMERARVDGAKRVVGYEANGGFMIGTPILPDEDISTCFLGSLPTRDAAIVHIAVICYAKGNDISLSLMADYLPGRIVMSDRLRNFPTDVSQQKMEDLDLGGTETIRLAFACFGELLTIDRTDGLRITFEDGAIIHLRPSGNAPELRCYAEADTKEHAASLLCRTMTILDSWRRRSQNETYPYSQ